MFFVSGATGHIGSEVMRSLARAGRPVRALSRDPGRAALPDGVEGVAGDLNRLDTFAEALSGVEAAFLLSGYDHLRETLAAMSGAGVRRVVLLSSSAAPGRDLSNAIAEYHIRAEDLVRESGLDWTFLQPNSFMANAEQWVPQLKQGDVIKAPFAGVAISTIDPYDVAACAVAGLLGPEHVGQSYRLTGPEALLPADRVRILSDVLGRELRFVAQSDDEAREQMLASMPEKYVNASFDFFVGGAVDETTVNTAVREITGRPPRTFRQWVEGHREVFA